MQSYIKPALNLIFSYQPPLLPVETICDGLDDDGDGVIDNNMVSVCGYPLGSFSICGACPVDIPSFAAPSPALQSLGIEQNMFESV